MTITELAPRIRAGQLSPVDLVDAAIAQAERLAHLNTFITPMFESARSEAWARQESIARGGYRGPLDGIPIGIKDNLRIAGVKATAGTKALDNNVALEDAEAVVRLRAAGAIVLGKENLHELAAGGRSNNPHYGVVRNPWDADRIPGGSSGGSGANVAACITHASLGTDIGGSVRFPAHCCGVVGMKQTFGRASQRGLMLTSFDGDHISPRTRTVSDSALVLQAYAGYDPLDPTTVPVPVPDFSADLGHDLHGVKVGVPANFFFDVVSEDVEACVRAAIIALEGLGAELVEVRFPYTEYARALWVLMASEASVTMETLLREHGEDVSEDLATGMLATQFILGRDYIKARKLQRLIKEGFAEVLRDVDVIAAPVAPLVAVSSDADVVVIKGVEYSLRLTRDEVMGHQTHLGNRTGLPAISVPCGFGEGGMPVGLQLIGRPFDEPMLYRIASTYEEISPSLDALSPLATD